MVILVIDIWPQLCAKYPGFNYFNEVRFSIVRILYEIGFIEAYYCCAPCLLYNWVCCACEIPVRFYFIHHILQALQLLGVQVWVDCCTLFLLFKKVCLYHLTTIELLKNNIMIAIIVSNELILFSVFSCFYPPPFNKSKYKIQSSGLNLKSETSFGAYHLCSSRFLKPHLSSGVTELEDVCW